MPDTIEIASSRGMLRLRPEREDDLAFRLRLFGDSRPDLALVPLAPAAREQLVGLQFRAQTLSYGAQFPQARFDIIELDGVAIGRIVVDRSAAELRIVDQALVPAFRGLGIGSTILRALMEEAGRAQRPLRLHVASNNDAAKRLYARLGFVPIATSLTYTELEWRAPAQEPGSGPPR
jgi:ribosomal protein S18 acetylase RimI-like enzyme